MDQINLIKAESIAEESDQAAISALGTLLDDSRLYKSSKDYKELLDFVGRMKNFAPFNALLLQIQKPGLMYAATVRDWRIRFNRTIQEGARPLLIMWPFAPVALVYDVQDTQGDEIPEDALNTFIAYGDVSFQEIKKVIDKLHKKEIEVYLIDQGDGAAGSIRYKGSFKSGKKIVRQYKIQINMNHKAPVQLVTVFHELGHLFLGHIGEDKNLQIKGRMGLGLAQMEIEAESVAYVLAKRIGVDSKSAAYLSSHINKFDTEQSLDIYHIMWASGKIEALFKGSIF